MPTITNNFQTIDLIYRLDPDKYVHSGLRNNGNEGYFTLSELKN